MPDVWTANPQKLRGMLNEGGFQCGREARIIKPRDPEWTCHITRENWYGDVYIHSVWDLFSHPYFFVPILLAAVLGTAAGYALKARAAP